MGKPSKALFYALTAISMCLAVASLALGAVGDADHAALVFSLACYAMLMSGWVWFDSRIDL